MYTKTRPHNNKKPLPYPIWTPPFKSIYTTGALTYSYHLWTHTHRQSDAVCGRSVRTHCVSSYSYSIYGQRIVNKVISGYNTRTWSDNDEDEKTHTRQLDKWPRKYTKCILKQCAYIVCTCEKCKVRQSTPQYLLDHNRARDHHAARCAKKNSCVGVNAAQNCLVNIIRTSLRLNSANVSACLNCWSNT